MISPGWGGLCIRIAIPSVIVLVIDGIRIFIDELERDPPVAAHRHRAINPLNEIVGERYHQLRHRYGSLGSG